MSYYGELIEKINDLVPEARSNSQYYTASVLKDAADAIEELQEDNTFLEGTVLKPCPFCGCTTLNKIVVTDRGAKNRMWSKILSWRVECNNCGAMSGETSNEENATFAWNRRAE